MMHQLKRAHKNIGLNQLVLIPVREVQEGILPANIKEPLTIEHDLLADLNNTFSIVDGIFTLEYMMN